MKPFPVSFNVSVTGGIGNSTFVGSGDLTATSIQPPAGPTSTFDYSILDSDGFGIAGKDSNVGNTTVMEGTFVLNGGVFHILNATQDGIYQVKLILNPTQWGLP